MSSLVDASDPSYWQLEKVLSNQKSAIKNALRRKGENPKDLQGRAQCVREFEMASLNNQMGRLQAAHLMVMTVIGHPYPPLTAPVENLKKVMIKDLNLETNHRGSYVLLRFVCTAMRMTAMMNIVGDEAGSVVPFATYMQEAETEPYFKLGTNGQCVIRVDQPTDIVWLSDNDPRIPAKWRILRDGMTNVAEYWKKKGNDFVGKAKYYDAIDMYSKALQSHPTPEEQDIIYRNRALAYLKTESFDRALDDIACVSDPQEKGLCRKALALYGLGRFKDAMEVLRNLVDTYPSSGSGKQELD